MCVVCVLTGDGSNLDAHSISGLSDLFFWLVVVGWGWETPRETGDETEPGNGMEWKVTWIGCSTGGEEGRWTKNQNKTKARKSKI